MQRALCKQQQVLLSRWASRTAPGGRQGCSQVLSTGGKIGFTPLYSASYFRERTRQASARGSLHADGERCHLSAAFSFRCPWKPGAAANGEATKSFGSEQVDDDAGGWGGVGIWPLEISLICRKMQVSPRMAKQPG